MNTNDIFEHDKRMDDLINAEAQSIAGSLDGIGNMSKVMFALGGLTVAIAAYIFL